MLASNFRALEGVTRRLICNARLRDGMGLDARWHRRYWESAATQSAIWTICTTALPSPSTEVSPAYYFRKTLTSRTVHSRTRPRAGGWGNRP